MSSTSPKLNALGKLTIGAETSFGNNASGGNTKYVKAVSVDLGGLEKAALVDEHQRQGDYTTAKIIGPATGTITTTHYLSGWNGAGSSIAAQPAMNGDLKTGGGSIDGYQMLMAVLGSALGNVVAGGYANDVNTGTSSTDAFNCTAGSGGTPFTIGQGVSWEDDDGMSHVGYAKNVTSGAVTLLQTAKAKVKDPDSDPSSHNGKLYGSFTVYKTTGRTYHDLNNCKSFTLTVSGHDSDDSVVATGCQPIGCTMSVPVGELPTFTVTWGVSHWTESGSGGLGGSPLVSEAWQDQAGANLPLCEPFTAGWVTTGGSQANPTRISSLEVDFGISAEPIPDPSFTSGVGGFGPITRAPTVSFSVFRDFSEEVTDFNDQTAAIWSFTMGSQVGKMINILVPAGRLDQYPERGEESGAVTSSMVLVPNYYDGDTNSMATDQSTPLDSDFRICFA